MDFRSLATLMEALHTNQDRADLSRFPHAASHDVLRVCDLSVNFRLDQDSESTVVNQVSFAIARSEIVGLLGESGCGKTTTALAILQLLPPSAHLISGAIDFHGQTLLNLSAERLRQIRGFQISMIYQDSAVLNPVLRVGDQVMEVLRAHRRMTSAQMRDEVFSVFEALQFEDCDRTFRAYPHQLSGGQRRRIAIAQALVCRPRLVIADEPTAWLDSSTASEMLAVFAHLRNLYETAFLLISHDPHTLTVADRILVMYAGQIVESGIRDETFRQPKHPYTSALLECRPQWRAQKFVRCKGKLPCIPGSAPDPSERFSGCSFSARCSDRMDACDSQAPQFVELSAGRAVRCFKYGGQG
jgi:oligopeptide/dipeptide ABC transporter ATP-binding protein